MMVKFLLMNSFFFLSQVITFDLAEENKILNKGLLGVTFFLKHLSEFSDSFISYIMYTDENK